MEKEVLLYWLTTFRTCRQTAIKNCPHNVYSLLRFHQFIDCEQDLTQKAEEYLRQEGFVKCPVPEDAHGLECLAHVTT